MPAQDAQTFVRTQDPVLSEALKNLGPESYTAHRLQHASSEHLYLTTRRCFIGPIPEGWLKSHRKEWYKHYLHVNRRDRAPSFNANVNQGRQRRLTGLDGPSTSAAYRSSFPQPCDAGNDEEERLGNDDGEEEGDDISDQDDVATLRPVNTDEEEDLQEGNSDDEATLEAPPAIDIPRSAPEGEDPALRRESGQQAEQTLNSYSTAKTVISPTSSHRPGNFLNIDSSTGTDSSSLGKRPVSTSSASFKTASEGGSILIDEPGAPGGPLKSQAGPGKHHRNDEDDDEEDGMQTPRAGPSTTTNPFDDTTYLSPSGPGPDSMTSQSPLLKPRSPSLEPIQTASTTRGVTDNDTDTSQNHAQEEDGDQTPTKTKIPHSPGTVRFAEPEVLPMKRRELQMRARLAQSAQRRLPRRFTRGKLKDGEIVKMEKMLVKLDITSGSEQPGEDYDEKDSQRVETRTIEKWREFMVVCRESHDEDSILCLEMYKTRVIPASNKEKTGKRYKHKIDLSPVRLGVNLYSALDKTLVLWQPKGLRTSICFLRPRTSASAVEWYTFLRGVLGKERPRTLQVNIPDLNVSLRVDNPFASFESAQHMADAADGDEVAMMRTMKEEQAIAGKIIDGCLNMLAKTGEWSDILPKWAENDRVGLAWKRYDRLEWIHGANERKMYGTLAMQRTHELELRPKHHYPTSINPVGAGGEMMVEPAPVEGFLIRLTSQKGNEQKLGRLFYKRLYFTTFNQHLLFNRPAKAAPPPPPKMPMQDSTTIPTVKQISEKIPLIYAVNPFPMHHEKVAWLDPDTSDPETMKAHDQDAWDEANRNVHALLNCDGFINMCDVVKVRKMKPGASPVDEHLDSGSDVDFDESVDDSRLDDGITTEPDSERSFELVLRNGLIVRLQAFSKATRKEWVKRLRALVTYWSIRLTNDLDTFKSVRRQNLATMNIDERAEAYVGQFAHKWEVVKSFASPELYNMCGISTCRTIHRSGILFRKPRLHKTFTRCHVILSHGHLIIFEDTLRKVTGKKIVHVHHERIACIDLKDCYLYSGLITEGDLLYQNRTFDNTMPGNHALPRLYAEDNWTSTDEDAMTTFVIWHSQKKSWFKSGQDQDDVKEARKQSKRDKKKEEGRGKVERRLKRVSQLGVPGRSVVFKARSRAERDHWVMGIADEIERLSVGEDVRLIGEDGRVK